MKKISACSFLFCSAIFLIFAHSVFAYQTIEGGCLSCHTKNTLHDLHNSGAAGTPKCTECHPGTPGATPIPSSNCIVCHPRTGPGWCQLVSFHDPGQQGATCLDCHAGPPANCAPSTTTTSVRPTTTTSTVAATTTTTVPASTTTSVQVTTTSTVAATSTTTVPATSTSTVPASTTTSVQATATSTVPASTTTSVQATTTSTVAATTTTTVPVNECSIESVQSTVLPLKSGMLGPRLRRIIITGTNSNWDRTSAVSIGDINIVIPLRTKADKITALILIPSKRSGFEPGLKNVTVATGSEECAGAVEIGD